ncbi:hypothetical protein DFQ27_007130 [Actinomortierella ambigua]|uniref:Nucleolar 27S pre-rRNA processing Urb2/Npa2 C-terminal domain-containing protein n=1 Tax=Actinomortierella ambigua TaxID=1343610 RepID=A0A9P6QIX0_9FUNG|nr:hypothetical protein DFQ27_007130 [Actinomortierella ambigua]
MESVLSSSEAFAKALKGPQTSQADKIALARQAWERADVVLPHKQEFILEWLCTVLVRSATPSNKDATAMALVDAEYWRLLKDILAMVSLQSRHLKRLGYTTTGQSGSAHRMNGSTSVMSAAAITAAGSRQTLVDFQAPTILLRIPVIPMFTALIQRLAPLSSMSPDNDSTATTTSSKSKGKGKKAGGGSKATVSSMEQRPSTAVLELANACFELLLSNSMAEWFQPTLEQYTPLVHAALAILPDMFPEPSSSANTHAASSPSPLTSPTQSHDYSPEDKVILLSFSGITLDHFRRLMVIQANQKKVFGLITGKMLDALVCARFSIQRILSQDASDEATTAQMQRHGQDCLDSIGAILRHGLFHQDHLQEYTTSFNIAASSSSGGANDSEKAIQSYQKQLFDQMESMAKSNRPVAALDVLPILLVYFIEESRRRQRILASGGLDRSSGMDSARSTEFKFFTELYTLAKNQLPELSSMASDSSGVDRAIHVIRALNRLLGAVADLQMYQSSNDSISKAQYAFLETCFRTMSKYLTEADDLKDVPLQTITLQGLVRLAQLDDLILEAHLSRLWPTLLSPLSGQQQEHQQHQHQQLEQGPHATAQELASVLLETHGKSRQLGNYMSSLLKAMRSFLSTPEQLASSPVLSRGFLDQIPAIVRLHLPLAQAPFILEDFVSELKLHIMSSSASTASTGHIDNSNSTKKRKLNSGKGVQDGDGDSNDPESIRSAGMVVTLLVHFLKGLRITSTHQKLILAHFTTLFTDFISPVLQQAISASTSGLSKQFQERLLAPALQLHYALCKAATLYWEQTLSTEMLVRLTTAMTNALSKTKGSKRWAMEDSVTLLLNRVVLQHVHLCLCSPQTVMDETMTKTCQDLVEFTMSTCRLQELVAPQDAKAAGHGAALGRWDGLLSTAHGPSFLVASWQTQVNDWLDIVCRFGSRDAMALLADVITNNVFSSSSSSLSLTGRPEDVSIVSLASSSSGDEMTIQSLNQVLLRSANMYEVPRFRPVLVDAVLSKLIAFLRGPFKVAGVAKRSKDRDLMTMLESTLKQHHQSSDPSYQDVVKAFIQWLSDELASSNSSKKSKSVGKKDASIPQDQLLSLLSILHLLPIEYFDKRERDCVLVLMGVLDYSIQKHMRADTAGLRSLLLCRKVSLAIMRWRNDAGLLASDPVIVQGLLAYVPWNVSSQENGGVGDGVIQDAQGLGKALWETTSFMIQSLAHHSILLATGSSLSEHAGQQLIALLDRLQSWIEDPSDVIGHAKTTVDEALSVPGIQLCILSQACQAFVQSLEHLVSTLAKKKKKVSTTASSETEYEQRVEKASMLAGRIQNLIQQLEAKTLSHLSKTVFSTMNITSSGGDQMAMEVDDKDESDLVQSCQACLDHFELLKTLLRFRALVKRSVAMQLTLFGVVEQPKASKGSAKCKPIIAPAAVAVDSHDFLQSLFRLAGRLTTTLEHLKERHANNRPLQNMLHLVSILTAYTCEYLPTAESPAPQDQETAMSEDQVKGLLTLILRVSELGAIPQEDMGTLKDAYLAMLGHLSGEMFEKTLEYLLDNPTYSNGRDIDVNIEDRPGDKLILVKLLEVTFLGSHQSQKRKVRKHISKLVARMIRILQTSDTVDMVVEVLGLLAGLCSELDFELRPWEIGLILEAITTLMSPATPLLVGSMVTSRPSSRSTDRETSGATTQQNDNATATPPLFTTPDAVRVFSGVYRVLTHIARFRQEALVELIPVFTAVLQAIFHGFKSIHPSIARKQQGMHTLMASQNPFPLLTHRCLASRRSNHSLNDLHGIRKPHDTTLSSMSASTLTTEEPLPVECAENFARLLTALGSKAVVATSNSMGLEPPTTITNTDGTTGAAAAPSHQHHHRGRQQPLDTSKAFSKHAPYLLTEYFRIQSSVVASISLLPLRQALLPGLYALMDLCTEWERELMMANLDATGKSLLKSLYSDYLKYHKYTGR